MDHNSDFTTDKDTSSPLKTSKTSEEVEVYLTALSYLAEDYNILLIEFDKDKDKAVENKYAALGLDSMDRHFDVEDKILGLKKAVARREERVAKGKGIKASYFKKEQDYLVAIDHDFNHLREHMQELRGNLEGSGGYVYKKTNTRFKMIKGQATGNSLPCEDPAVEYESTKNATFQDTVTFQKSCGSSFSAQSTSADEGITIHEAMDNNNALSESPVSRKRERHPDPDEAVKDTKRQKKEALSSSPSQAAQSGDEHTYRRSSRRVSKRANSTFPKTSTKRSRSRRKIKQAPLQLHEEEPKEEEYGAPIVDESVIMEFAKRFFPASTASAEHEEIQQLKLRIEEQEAKMREMARYTEMIRKERDELRKDRQEAWEALADERRELRSVTERKERYKRLLKNNRRSRHTRAGDCTSEESDSEEEIPAQMKMRYEVPRS